MDQTNSFALADFEGDGKLEVICADGTGLGRHWHAHNGARQQ
jgi:hypothetical protein